MKTRIYLETSSKTSSEYVFIKTLLEKLRRADYEIICVGGKNKLREVANKFHEHTAEGGENIIIFDADSANNGDGYANAMQRIREQIATLGIEVAGIFLFPNNADDGIFENLLEHLIRKDLHQTFLDCFSDYEACLGKNYEVPDIKGKMYEYIIIQKGLSDSAREHIKKGDWLWGNSDYWDLDACYLQPLKDFLCRHVSSR